MMYERLPIKPLGKQDPLPDWARNNLYGGEPNYLVMGLWPSGEIKRRIFLKSSSALNKGREWEARGMEVVRIALYPSQYRRMTAKPYKGGY